MTNGNGSVWSVLSINALVVLVTPVLLGMGAGGCVTTTVDALGGDPCGEETSGEACDGTDTGGELPTGDGDGDGDPTGTEGDGDGDGDPTGDGDGDGDDVPADTTPPTVVAFDPPIDSVGVLPDAVITIEFSEPMDKLATQAAYDSDDLPAAAATMTWDPTGTILTITPEQPLELGEGSDPGTVEARTYAYAITTGARDLAGNQLETAAEANFATIRRILLELAPEDELSGSITRGTVTKQSNCLVGDDLSDRGTVLLMSFAIAGLPEGVAQFERATVRANHTEATAGVYTELGDVVVEYVQYSQFDLGPVVAGTPLGVYSSDASPGWREYDAAQLLSLGYLSEADRLQLRFAFETESNDDQIYDRAWFDCASMSFEIDYLIP